ncbi:UNVERIFIED_CONTAM: hypothetical protein NCL1_20237 [Trichonephila clavipes]
MEMLTSSLLHFTETVQGLIKSLTFIIEMTLNRRYFNISRQLILFLRDFMNFLISPFSCDISTMAPCDPLTSTVAVFAITSSDTGLRPLPVGELSVSLLRAL